MDRFTRPASNPQDDHPLEVSLLGTLAVLFEAPGAMDLATQRRIWSLARTVQAWANVEEAVPGMANLMVTFSRPPRDISGIFQRLRDAWDASQEWTISGKTLVLPVVYGGEGGPHLDDVVTHTGLAVDDIVRRHAAPLYTVYALGSHPGYCYLGGMDPTIATPRRKVPVVQLPAGAVSIGGAQTGVSASAGPSGWNTIGSTLPDFFDAAHTPPARLAPGDMVRFDIADVIYPRDGGAQP
ncbi:5-oxoprolinase subunit PxpB [Robbsia sp. Bb-Pol-6]|uniref:5-oxoprolinase subunit PxpB n=1 Tax=Robbsia betulipollinis TaxID=2981849 RepID=A0ABT3ZHA1_9BURK|nr:5-oxoprolinase subunit PxpB [Robbsia betulipollinis]MCY0385899.1 5-oxoprolinase subunit PxpB [Robbsia betulipollinis]